MSGRSDPPWLKIHDFLAEVGTAASDEEFIRLVMRRIEDLVPCDLPCVFGAVDPRGRLCPAKTVVESRKWFERFKDHYWSLIPDLRKEPGVNTKLVDWDRYLATEYATDFMAPQRIRYSLGVSLGAFPGFSGTLALDRTKSSRPFSQDEQKIMEVLQPHLSNYYHILTAASPGEPATPSALELQEAFPCLTGREAEVAALLCQRYGTEMIQSRLFISRLTVYKHVENIFAKLGVRNRSELAAKLQPESATGPSSSPGRTATSRLP